MFTLHQPCNNTFQTIVSLFIKIVFCMSVTVVLRKRSLPHILFLLLSLMPLPNVLTVSGKIKVVLMVVPSVLPTQIFV